MSSFVRAEIHCDEPGCERTYDSTESGHSQIGATRKAAQEHGWRERIIPAVPPRQYARALDLCPDHANPP